MSPRTPLLVALLAAATPLGAQEGSRPAPPEQPAAAMQAARPALPRVHAGAGGDYSRPVGALHRQVPGAGGLQGHVRIRLDDEGLVALRLQGGFVGYGHESQRSCLAPTPGCRVMTTVSTTNGIASFTVGPEVFIPMGRVRAFAHGLVGMSRFTTFSNLDGGLLASYIASDENQGDGGLMWSAGAGIQVPMGSRFALDLGVAFEGHGRREYLLKGGITDNPDGSLDLDLKRSPANLVSLRIGFTTALRRRTRSGGGAPGTTGTTGTTGTP